MAKISGSEQIEQKINQIFEVWESIGKPKGHQIFYVKIELTPEVEGKERNIVNLITDLLRIYTRNRVHEYILYAKTWFLGKAYLSIIIPIRWFSKNEISWNELSSRIINDIQSILKLKVTKIFNGFIERLTNSYPKFMKILKMRVVFFLKKFQKVILSIAKTKKERDERNERNERNIINTGNFIGNLLESIERKVLEGFT